MNDDLLPPKTGETDTQRFARELIEILNEIRVALPGVQMLFAFEVMVPFTARFGELTDAQRSVFFASFLATTVATMMLIAPSVYHRLHWRREIEDKERMLRSFTRLAVAGAAFLAVAMALAVYLITDFLFGPRLSWGVTAAATIALVGLWFALPLSRRRFEQKKGPIRPQA